MLYYSAFLLWMLLFSIFGPIFSLFFLIYFISSFFRSFCLWIHFCALICIFGVVRLAAMGSPTKAPPSATAAATAAAAAGAGVAKLRETLVPQSVTVSPKSFVLLYALLGTVQAMVYVYFIGTLTSFERRFRLPSVTTGEQSDSDARRAAELQEIREPTWRRLWPFVTSLAPCDRITRNQFVLARVSSQFRIMSFGGMINLRNCSSLTLIKIIFLLDLFWGVKL